MAKMGPRNPEATRSAILDAAEAAFLERGVADVPLSEVAQRAGVTKSLIHHHFDSKAGLWGAVKAKRFFRQQQRELLLAAEGDDPEALRAVHRAYFLFLRENPEFVRLYLWLSLECDPGALCEGDPLVDLAAERVRSAQSAGHYRGDLDPVHVTVTAFGLCWSWFLARRRWVECWRRGPEAVARGAGGRAVSDEEADESFLETMLSLFERGVLRRQP